MSRRIREAIGVPLWLAGGLHAGKVAAAIATAGPFGVDVCSGVRTDGRPDRVTRFVTAVRAAAA